jgi:cobalt-zinc-cadmium efflux system protein
MTVREKAETLLHEKFGIQHITLQFGYNCCCGNKLLINNI